MVGSRERGAEPKGAGEGVPPVVDSTHVHGTASATLTGSAHPRDPQRAPYPLSINGGTRPT
ncbi:Uncharacterized protein DBV15_05014 [Temnothorax longispinosus]|uniref:Uncharacterized protein n=1 Tax=Temnothorax longispinosus TaxID=300112 RepID=A0A4V3SAK9_9HYME|nr:Uncharacterized protein DBV15_05014 [Temnothorax longispinosus]